MTEHKITTTMELDEEFLSDVMITAFDSAYGGAWYWCEPSTTTRTGALLKSAWETKQVGESSTEERWMAVWIRLREEVGDNIIDANMYKTPLRFGHEDLVRAMQMVMDGKDFKGNPLEWNALKVRILSQDGGEIDSGDADLLVQLGSMGEVIFG